MNLEEIKIVNFRSIADMSILTTPACQGFVGINESGKSNILSAISLLSSDITPNEDDVRMEGADEERDQESYVKYKFKLTQDELTEIVGELIDGIYFESELPKLKIAGKNISVEDFFYEKNAGLYYCDIKNGAKHASYYNLINGEISPIPWLKKVKDGTTASITVNSGENISLSEYKFVALSCIPDANLNLFDDCTTKDLNKAFGNIQGRFIEKNLPNVVYWKYDSKYLLPSSVSLNDFRDDPSICIPLKSMFLLAGYHDITTALDDIENKPPHKLESILRKVSKKSTEYLRKVWKDYKRVCFELRQNGPKINIHIQDSENLYACEQRSDGFKRFVTFLLALSAPVNNGEITNSIIVVDEPDMGIHISGQKYLAKELIRISEKNLVFYSTHSIFMIDRQYPPRHFIVKKENEITTTTQVTESNYTDDEVIFNALGYSIFEALKPRNIIFEGWADKHVFEIACASKKASAVKELKDFGYVHSSGVRCIVNIAKDLELANRKYCVISDSDKPALDKRKEYQQSERCQGVWYTYDDILNGIFTLEDFIKHETFKKSIELARENYPDLVKFNFADFSTHQFEREEFLKSWIRSSISDGKLQKEILRTIKDDLYSRITVTGIEDCYFEFLQKLNDTITM